MTIARGCHRTRAWKSWPVMMCCMIKSRRAFASGSFRPWILVMNSPLTKRHFFPVTGCTRTRGCTVVTGSFRTRPPIKRVCAIIFDDVCTASSRSRKEPRVADKRLAKLSVYQLPIQSSYLVESYLYAASVAAKTVSPPTSGPSNNPSIT